MKSMTAYVAVTLLICAIAPNANATKAEKRASEKAVAPVTKSSDELRRVINKLQTTYDTTTDFSANFQQKYHHKVLRRSDESSGSLRYKKPGKMRWDYQKPSKKSFIVDGKSLWIDQRDDHVAYVDKCFKQDGLTASIAFLWGGGKINEQFGATWFEGQFGEKNDHHIALEPKQKNSVFKRLILVVDAKSFRVVQSVVVDLEGNVNQFIFSDLKFNQKLAEKEFRFDPPKGTHVSPVPGSCIDAKQM